jgi:predicted small lipoprotein YifL
LRVRALTAALLFVAVALAACGKYGPPRRVQRVTPPPAAVEQQEQTADPEEEAS